MMSEITHEEALEIAIEYGAGSARDLEHMMREYMKARGLVMMPRTAPFKMLNTVYERAQNREFEAGDWSETYEAFVAAAPDPFAPSP
jgi:hypothetical protein